MGQEDKERRRKKEGNVERKEDEQRKKTRKWAKKTKREKIASTQVCVHGGRREDKGSKKEGKKE